MKIAAIVGVKDEVELIGPAIEHLEQIGVEEILVYDSCSVDGTEQVLARYAAQGRIRWQQQDDLHIDAASDREAHLALIRSCDADWVMSLDADEFPLCSTGDLRTCPELRSGDFDFITLARRNVVLGPHGLAMQLPPFGQALDEIMLVAQPLRDYWSRPDLQATEPWIRSAIMPKMLGRRDAVAQVTDGMHNFLAADGQPGRRVRGRTLFVAHVPFSSQARFETKVRNIHRFMSAHEDQFENQAWHWKRWRQQLLCGELAAEYQQQVLAAETIAALTAQGVVTDAAQFLWDLLDDTVLA